MNYKIALSVDLSTTFTYNIANLLKVDIHMFKTAFFGFFFCSIQNAVNKPVDS